MSEPKTEEQRASYVKRLYVRVGSLIAQSNPKGINTEGEEWARIEEADRKATLAVQKYLNGRGTKQEVDDACLAVIQAWRSLPKK